MDRTYLANKHSLSDSYRHNKNTMVVRLGAREKYEITDGKNIRHVKARANNRAIQHQVHTLGTVTSPNQPFACVYNNRAPPSSCSTPLSFSQHMRCRLTARNKRRPALRHTLLDNDAALSSSSSPPIKQHESHEAPLSSANSACWYMCCRSRMRCKRHINAYRLSAGHSSMQCCKSTRVSSYMCIPARARARTKNTRWRSNRVHRRRASNVVQSPVHELKWPAASLHSAIFTSASTAISSPRGV